MSSTQGGRGPLRSGRVSPDRGSLLEGRGIGLQSMGFGQWVATSCGLGLGSLMLLVSCLRWSDPKVQSAVPFFVAVCGLLVICHSLLYLVRHGRPFPPDNSLQQLASDGDRHQSLQTFLVGLLLLVGLSFGYWARANQALTLSHVTGMDYGYDLLYIFMFLIVWPSCFAFTSLLIVAFAMLLASCCLQ